MTTRDLALVTAIDAENPVLGDLRLKNGELVVIEGADAVAQEAQVVLKWPLGDWFLDPSRGVPYIQELLRKGVTEPTIRSVIRRALLLVPDLALDPEITVEIDRTIRRAVVGFAGETTDGDGVAAADVEVG